LSVSHHTPAEEAPARMLANHDIGKVVLTVGGGGGG